MQISDRINERSSFSCLLSMRSELILLLLNNYPEFAQGSGFKSALGVGLVLLFAL